MLDQLIDLYPDEDLLIADGFDGAIIGIDEKSMRVIYSVKKCIEILVVDQLLTNEEAIEHFEFNVAGSYMGEKTPIWCYDNFLQ
jgi:hypothetical protein